MGRFDDHFPKNPEDAKHWTPYTAHHALAQFVLVVATTRIEGMWCAYIDKVPGFNPRQETERVLHHGNKLAENVARVLFPEFDDVPYAS